MKIGHFSKQPQGYKAFIPEPFPPHEGFDFPKKLIQKASHATLSLGKLDGVTQLLPDVDFFLFMYICKDAASSSQTFLDGNGRTGRMLITLFLWLEKLLDRTVLFLSSYFKKHQKTYYDRINGYHEGKVEHWLDFFLDGIIDTSMEAIEIAKKITALREQDMKKIHSLGKTEAKSAIDILFQLFKLPVTNVAKVQEWTGFTRQGAHKVIKRFIDLEILYAKDENKTYGQSYIYRRYVDIFKD